MFSLEQFIKDKVIMRPESMFLQDIGNHEKELSSNIQGSSVLVIGGAGTIGSSFIKAILPFHPESLIVVDINENGLAELTRDLRSTKGIEVPSEYIPYPMDYASLAFQRMFRMRKGFDIVANFSAHKHVRSEKDIISIEALLRNNVLNAKSLMDLLAEYPPKTYFCVSTDKAANPVNIMGASKRIMEDLIFSYSDCFPVKTARFANVAFSNGSLPDGFLSRIKKRQPLSAPYDVKRYFVSPEESGQICMLSCILGDNRNIFFPKLSESQMMTFDLIATRLLEEFGYDVLLCESEKEAIEKAAEPGSNENRYPVYFSKSDTAGEKPYEEFVTAEETADLKRFLALGVITGKGIPDRRRLHILIKDLGLVFEKEQIKKDDIVILLQTYLPNFRHIETGKSLDDKM